MEHWLREGDTTAISKRMYMVTVTAFVLWIAYGFVIGALPLIVFNSLSLALSGTILFLKTRNDRVLSQLGSQHRKLRERCSNSEAGLSHLEDEGGEECVCPIRLS